MNPWRSSVIVVALTTLALVLGLSACGGSDDETSAEPQPAESAPPVASTEPAPPASETTASAEPITLVVWDFKYVPERLQPVLEKLDQEYMQDHPNVTIEHTGIPYSELLTKLRTTIAAKKGPDIVSIYPGIFAADFRDGLIPLEDRITPEQTEQLANIPESKAPDGHTYALPYTVYGYHYIYNKTLFRQAGLDPDAPPTTWDEFLKACDTLSAAGITPITGGWKDGYQAENYWYITSGQLMTPEQLEQFSLMDFPYTSPEMVKSLELLIEANNHKCWGEHPESKLLEDGGPDFLGGKGAMYLSTGREIRDAAKEFGPENVGVMLQPPVPGSHYPPIMDSGPNGGWAITRWSEHPDEAYDYISFLESVAAQERLWTETGELPNNRAAETPSDYAPEAQFLEWIKIPENHTNYMAFPQIILTPFERRAPDLFAGRIAVDELLKQLEEIRQKVEPKFK